MQAFTPRRLEATVALAAALLLGSPGPVAAQEDPWAALAALRLGLEEGGAQSWDFQQTFLPAGFSTGELETGRLVLGLPRCVRWDYHDPYPKSFLLCGSELHAWNPGEPVGQIYALDEAQPGLDLLLLSVSVLRSRYDATVERQNGARRILLTPRGTASDLLQEAELVLAPGGQRLQRLAYRDAEGNRTTFDFTNARAFRGRGVFTPPRDVRWEREGRAGRRGA
jgi:hypothetical protein